MPVQKNRLLGLMAGVACLTGFNAEAVEFGSFADIRYADSDRANDNGAFVLGQLDLYATQEIDDDTTAFIEYVFENDGSGFVTDVERLWIKRKINPFFNVSAGRFHSPLGYWNRNFHHGVLIQDTVSRPSFLDFEDGESAILPMHVIGLMLSGGALMGGWELGYEIVAGNSYTLDSTQSPNASTPGAGTEIGLQNVSDIGDKKSFIGRVTIGSDGFPLKLGIFTMSATYFESATLGGDSNFGSQAFGKPLVEQMVYGVDAFGKFGNLKLLAEYFNISNDADFPGGEEHDATAFYVQAAYRLLTWLEPVYRYESLSNIDPNDPYFSILATEKGKHHVVALRFDLDESNAIMLEANFHKPDDPALEDEKTYTASWAFLLF